MRTQNLIRTNWQRGDVMRGTTFPLFVCLLITFLFGADLRRQPKPEQLLMEGHAAFDRGDYAGAEKAYEQAERYSTDPVDVAYYLAATKYHLAAKTEGPSPELLEAEQLYRCCL